MAIKVTLPPIFIQRWVPIPQWIQKKILLLVFKCLSDLALPYLSDLLHPYTPSAQLQLLFSLLLASDLRPRVSEPLTVLRLIFGTDSQQNLRFLISILAIIMYVLQSYYSWI